MSCLQKTLFWDTIAGACVGAIWIVPATWMPSGLAAMTQIGIRSSCWSVWILWKVLGFGSSKSRHCAIYIGMSPKLGPRWEWVHPDGHRAGTHGLSPPASKSGTVATNPLAMYAQFTPFSLSSRACDYVTSLCCHKMLIFQVWKPCLREIVHREAYTCFPPPVKWGPLDFIRGASCPPPPPPQDRCQKKRQRISDKVGKNRAR